MDTFMNLAKQGMEAYTSKSGGSQTGGQGHNPSNDYGQSRPPQSQQQWNYGSDSQGYDSSNNSGQSRPPHSQQQWNYGSDSDVRKTGGQEYNTPHHSSQQGNYGPDIDHDEVVRTGQDHGPGHSDIFSSALSYINNNKQHHNEPINDDHVINAHQQAYQNDNARGLDAGSLGSAAAMQVFKKFTSGGGSSSGSGGGNMQTQLISMAMSEATKLFDKSGGGASGNKQDAVNGAAMTVMKMMVQSKLGGGGTTGGSNSGGLGSLMSMASKFL